MAKSAELKFRKHLLLLLLVISSLSPLIFVKFPDQPLLLNLFLLLAKAGSLVGTMLIAWQFLLGFRALTARVIPDLLWLLNLHKTIGKYILLLILLHPVFITLYYINTGLANPLTLQTGRPFDTYVTIGMVALALFILVVVSSLFFLRSKIEYRNWFHTHLTTWVALPLVFIHSLPIGQTVGETGLGIFWYALLGLMIAVGLVRVLHRFGVLGPRRHRVTQVQKVAPGVTEITAVPLRRPVEPKVGQFIYFRRSLGQQVRPFTVSRYDYRTGALSVTVKAQGGTTKDLQDVQPGETVHIDGPYGVFAQAALNGARPIVMIAGGIGITPFHRIVNELDSAPDMELYLFYGNRNRREIAYKDEFDRLEHIKVVHVLSMEEEFPEGESGFITPELMKKYLPGELKNYEFLLCGPPPMTRMLEKALMEEEAVPDDQIDHEVFSY